MERIDEQGSEFFAQRCAARLARKNERDRRVREVFVQQADLRRFSGALDALERDEEPAFYCAGSLNNLTRRLGSMPVDLDSRRYFSAS